MNNKALKITMYVCLVWSSVAFASDAKVTIKAPTDGAKVKSSDKIKVSYEAVPGPDGDHLHLYVDGKRVDVLRELKGSAEVGPLAAGAHKICMQVNTRAHVPLGAERCVSVTAQ